MHKLCTIVLLILLLSSCPLASAEQWDQVRDQGKTCYDYAVELAREDGWGVVVEYNLPYSNERTHYSAYKIIDGDLHLRGRYYNSDADEWKEYSYYKTGMWAEVTDEYYHFWENPDQAIRSCKKSQIRDNRELVL
jgi:hypothetical protein